ncbi:DUF2189 domain-containing protein (plasmid) [Pseudorhodobacter turbinis]|uniref:DUF2189 domain-containing protein n=1 Tax=Pseudorhodobacter turbinis TaxID=2500533 RepID=A0A4V1E137_9RHOB|nr:DUF2189 domain-containing protein [Pseudorhodobacter turbinis]QCO56774.1 DUF2189 domain-containing protein [Pseudorhodobacter turbinis]
MSHPAATAPPKPEVLILEAADLRASLAAGWQDFRTAPIFGLFFAAVYVAGGWLILYALTATGQVWWTLPAAAGFPILGPFIACGLYEVSRRLEAGEPLSWGAVLGVVLRQKDRQIPSIAAVVVVFFLFWNFLAHMIFALFLGLQVMTNISTSFDVFLTVNGLMMLGVGTIVGAIFAGVLFALTVVSLPLLMDREVDFVTAMITSVSVVLNNPGLMLVWGVMIALMIFVGMALGFFGLFIVLPVLGHATWHLYRRALA